MKMRRVIVESPFAGDVERNFTYLRLCMHDCFLRGEAPFASHGLYTQEDVLDDDIPQERKTGIKADFMWGETAELRVIYTDLGISDGMYEGILEARRIGQPRAYRALKRMPGKVLCLGIIGGQGAGKGTFVGFVRNVFRGYLIRHHASSDLIKNTLELWNIEFSRKHAQILPRVMENGYGKGVLSDAMRARLMREKDFSDILIFDGVRLPSDVSMLRDLPIPTFLVYIRASRETRFHRLREREEEKTGEKNLSWDEFMEREMAYTEQFIDEIGENADCIIDNNNNDIRSFEDKSVSWLKHVLEQAFNSNINY